MIRLAVNKKIKEFNKKIEGLLATRVPFRTQSASFEISWEILYAFCFYLRRHAYAYFYYKQA